MYILLVEDEPAKADEVREAVKGVFGGVECRFDKAETLRDASRKIYSVRYDLIVIDLLLPKWAGDKPEDVSAEVISYMELSEINRGVSAIALSGFEDVADQRRQEFLDAGIVVVLYYRDSDSWKRPFCAALERVRPVESIDFIIFTAIDSERSAYEKTTAILSPPKNILGLDCMPVILGERSGYIVKGPRMGLVDASSTVARILERYSPRLVAISGICAGHGDGQIGALIIADPCWEYQVGKWLENRFKIEHYDIGIDQELRTELGHMIADAALLERLKAGFECPVSAAKPIIGPMTTGSAVIASEYQMDQIAEQHRKMVALDMETYGVYRASFLAAPRPLFFGAKVVVDRADARKGDEFHEYGSVISARFVCAAVERIFAKLVK